MDYLTEKEIKAFKGEQKASEVAIEAEKYTFGKKLIEDMGPKMMDALNRQKEPQRKKENMFQRMMRKLKKKGSR